MNRAGIKLLALAAGVLLWFQLKAPSPSSAPRANGPAAGQTAENAEATRSRVFTPAHRSVRDAVNDFFDRREEPVQPIEFTHKVHLANKMQCTQCHVGVDTGPDARIPGVRVCMTCHQVIATDRPEIKKVAAYLARGEEIPWQRVYGYSPSAHVKFDHAPHIRTGVDCKNCHGDMTQRTVAIRTVELNMGFCLDCHKQKRASIDCTACHF